MIVVKENKWKDDFHRLMERRIWTLKLSVQLGIIILTKNGNKNPTICLYFLEIGGLTKSKACSYDLIYHTQEKGEHNGLQPPIVTSYLIYHKHASFMSFFLFLGVSWWKFYLSTLYFSVSPLSSVKGPRTIFTLSSNDFYTIRELGCVYLHGNC